MLVKIVPSVSGLDGVKFDAEPNVGDGLLDALVVFFFVTFVFVKVLKRGEHCAHGTTYDEGRFSDGNELKKFDAFETVVQVPRCTIIVCAFDINGMSRFKAMFVSEVDDAWWRVDFCDKVSF